MTAIATPGFADGVSTSESNTEVTKCETHNPTIEEVVDEEDLIKRHDTPLSNSVLEADNDPEPLVAPKPVKKANAAPVIDSTEEFPQLNGSKAKAPVVASEWGSQMNSGTPASAASEPASGAATPTSTGTPAHAKFTIPGQKTAEFSLTRDEMAPKSQMKRPLPEILKDIQRRLNAKVTQTTGPHGTMHFHATAPTSGAANQAIREIVDKVGVETTTSIPIPVSMKGKVIGKGGAVIKAIQEKTGAQINMPKDEGSKSAEDDDDATVNVSVKGNAVAQAAAREEILKLLGDRSSTVSQKLRTIPAEFYPFIAGTDNANTKALEQKYNDLRINVPTQQTWTPQAARRPNNGHPLSFMQPSADNCITLAGDKSQVMAARKSIESMAEELRRQLRAEQIQISRSRIPLIIGQYGIPLFQFVSETGCTLTFTDDSDDETVTVIGPAEKVAAAAMKAEQLAFKTWNSQQVDISKFHRAGPGGASAHAKNVTKYLQHRKELERLTRQHDTPIEAHATAGSFIPWEMFVRNDKNTRSQALNDIKSLVTGLPPSRMASIDVNPFFHPFLANNIASQLQDAYGVYTVVPNESEETAPVLLVFEGAGSTAADYQVPRAQGVPSAEEVEKYQRGLEEARKHILDLITQQDEIKQISIDVPKKFHEKLRKFITEQKKAQSPDEVPVRVRVINTTVTLQGPAASVARFEAKIKEFVAEQISDEKERGFSLSFPFQQKLASFLIGKGGATISQLSETFDVDVRITDGTVTITGPPAKADAAKAHIQKLEKQWADETTHKLKIEPKFHREIIGAQGNQIKKLESRYNVQIHFPRSGRQAKDDQSVDGASSATGGAKAIRRQQAEDEVQVKGPSRGADAARDEILNLLQYFKDHGFSATVSIQQSQVPSLIGQGGRALDELRQTTGAKIDVPSPRDSKSPSGLVDIEIKGTKAQVAAAKKVIEEKKAAFDNLATKTIEIEKKHHRSLIGPGGSVLREIVSAAGGPDDRHGMARTVQFPRNETDGNKIKVEGPSQVVEKIIARMHEIVAENESQITESIDIPTTQHRFLIGQGGNVKNEIQSEFSVKMNIPARGSGKTMVTVTGLPANVAAAKAKIEKLTKMEEGETVQVPRKFHHVISKDGAWFRQLQRDGVKVDHDGQKIPSKNSKKQAAEEQLPLITDDAEDSGFRVVGIAQREDEGDIPWVLRGDEAAVEKVKAQIAAALKQAESATHIGYLTLEDPRLNRHVIGQGGSVVNKIRSQSGCKIDVPKAGESRAAIEIVGSLEGVEKAKELILKAVEDGASRTVNHRRS